MQLHTRTFCETLRIANKRLLGVFSVKCYEKHQPPLKPSGRYSAPPVPPRQAMQLVAKGGSIRLAPVSALGANIAAGVAAYAIERAAQPALEYLGEKLARGLYSGYEAIFGDTDGMTFDELQAHHRQIEQEYLARIQRKTSPVV